MRLTAVILPRIQLFFDLDKRNHLLDFFFGKKRPVDCQLELIPLRQFNGFVFSLFIPGIVNSAKQKIGGSIE